MFVGHWLVRGSFFVFGFALCASAWFFSGAIRPGAPVPSSTPPDTSAAPVISNAVGCQLKDGVEGGGSGGGRRRASGGRGGGGRGLRKGDGGEGEAADTVAAASDKVRLGTFVLTNKDLVPFVLRVTLGNGGEMRHERHGEEAYFRLGGLALLYRDGSMVTVERPLSDDDYKGGGAVFEVMFWQEDVQGVYEMELWGSVDGGSTHGGSYGGVYREAIQLETEKLPFSNEF